MAEDSARWQTRFAEINQLYFGGCIPRYAVVVDSALEEGLAGLHDPETRTIHLRPQRWEALMEGVLVHEMVHAFLQHGPGMTDEEAHAEDFQRVIRRLIFEGATVDAGSYVEALDGLSDAEWATIDPAYMGTPTPTPCDVAHLLAQLPGDDEAATPRRAT